MLIRLYPLIVLIQAFCIYHAFKNKSDQKWYYLIIFLPLIGCAIYLYHHFYSRENVANVTEGVKSVLNTNYKIQKLEKELAFSESSLNKINLADAYMEIERFEDALKLYQSCNKLDSQSAEIHSKLTGAYFGMEDYEKAIFHGDQVKAKKIFQNTHYQVAYAWSLFNLDKIEEAESVFNEFYARYSNYDFRIEQIKFLILINKKSEALENLDEMKAEFSQMSWNEARPHKSSKEAMALCYEKLS